MRVGNKEEKAAQTKETDRVVFGGIGIGKG